jgi:arginyl-tRNA synthetase
MSSRFGNATTAGEVISAVRDSVDAENKVLSHQISIGAIKYAFLKNSVGKDLAFDIEQSVSTEGNSGPYLQYALVRARSILGKITDKPDESTVENLETTERRLASHLGRYFDVIENCLHEKSLHELCDYLFGLAQVFNQFYEKSRVIDDPRAFIRLPLVKKYEEILADGLKCLGIPAPEKM